MRHLHALIVATGLCVPSLALAAAPVDHGQRAMASKAAVQEPSERSVAQPTTTTAGPAATSDRARYAEEETKSGDAKDYRGGDTVVIGASAATAILAVILLIVLI